MEIVKVRFFDTKSKKDNEWKNIFITEYHLYFGIVYKFDLFL